MPYFLAERMPNFLGDFTRGCQSSRGGGGGGGIPGPGADSLLQTKDPSPGVSPLESGNRTPIFFFPRSRVPPPTTTTKFHDTGTELDWMLEFAAHWQYHC